MNQVTEYSTQGVNLGGHVHPTFPEVVSEIYANPVSFYVWGGRSLQLAT